MTLDFDFVYCRRDAVDVVCRDGIPKPKSVVGEECMRDRGQKLYERYRVYKLHVFV